MAEHLRCEMLKMICRLGMIQLNSPLSGTTQFHKHTQQPANAFWPDPDTLCLVLSQSVCILHLDNGGISDVKLIGL
eukprot:s462_g19.t1